MMFSSIKLPGQAHPVNPVLDAFREHVVFSGENVQGLAAYWLTNFGPAWHYWRRGRIPARKAHREHAKKVLRRIVNSGEVES